MASKTNKIVKLEQKDRLKELYLNTVNTGLELVDDLDSIDYYGALCKAGTEKTLYKMFSCNMCMFKYNYDGRDSVIIIFSIPSPSNPESKEDGDTRHISQKIMELVKVIEDCFIRVDYMNLKDVKEDKFSYFTIIKSKDI